MTVLDTFEMKDHVRYNSDVVKTIRDEGDLRREPSW